MNVICGGYYIITPIVRPDKNKTLIPETILSASNCICDFLPDDIVIWSDIHEEKCKYAQQLNISQSTYIEMERWLLNKDEEGMMRYPEVFYTVELAREFLSRFFSHLPNTKIIGIGLPEEFVGEFIKQEESRIKIEGEALSGVEELLLRRIPVEEKESNMMGYEVLGFDYGRFHSYLCYDLETDYNKHFKFNLNKNGFIPSLEDASRYCSYSNEDLGTPEYVLWLPWAIYEYTK